MQAAIFSSGEGGTESSSQLGALVIESLRPKRGYRLFVGNHHEPDRIWVREHGVFRIMAGFGETWVVSLTPEGELEVRVED
ncbi:hypothetical protein G6O69_16700 [Pseudenhygromyxa sp. WMMC2535]|uniref:hypothetical protein n=1 Tax=Pseudenhygromyxa sp. WMMC2535 TaxID=2712867 RepID=UPI0015537164|nr:hypothetical protein [Pseudenhygromyxa sp. WMMC2535]NVB39484.1 hypothetical protein [Pseudenhygromyxa sp. WMMC2535]